MMTRDNGNVKLAIIIAFNVICYNLTHGAINVRTLKILQISSKISNLQL